MTTYLTEIWAENFNNEDIRMSLAFVDSADVPIDLTGATIKFAMWRGAVRVEGSTADGVVVITDAEGGAVDLAVPQPGLAGIPIGSYRFDMLLIESGVRKVLTSGTINLKQGASAP